MKEMKIFTAVIFSTAFHHEYFWLVALPPSPCGAGPSLMWAVWKITGGPGRTRNQKQLPFIASGGLHP